MVGILSDIYININISFGVRTVRYIGVSICKEAWGEEYQGDGLGHDAAGAHEDWELVVVIQQAWTLALWNINNIFRVLSAPLELTTVSLPQQAGSVYEVAKHHWAGDTAEDPDGDVLEPNG